MNLTTSQPDAMSFAPARNGKPPKLAMAPMVDIVLLLICFYLLVAKTTQDQEDPEVRVPRIVSDQTLEEHPAELIVNLHADRRIVVNGETLTPDALGAWLTEQQAKALRQDRQAFVVVRADKRQRYGVLDEVLKTCREAGLSTVWFRATKQ